MIVGNYTSVNSYLNFNNIVPILTNTRNLIARTATVFRNFLQTIFNKTYYFPKKILAICNNELQSRFSFTKLKGVLCPTINMAQKSVIWRDENISKSKEFVELVTNPDYPKAKGLLPLESEVIKKLKESPIEGKTSAICCGIALFVIKYLLSNKPDSEAALIHLINQFRKGFPAEACALQHLYQTLLPLEFKLPSKDQIDLKKCKDEAKNELEHETAQDYERLTKIAENSNEKIFDEELAKIEAAFAEKSKKVETDFTKMSLYKKKVGKLNYISSAIDIILKRHSTEQYHEADFEGIINSKEQKDKFNNLENGYYLLGFKLDKRGHAINYIKREFGSYLLDSNTGLIKCDPHAPAEKLCELLNQYKGRLKENGEREHFLEIHQIHRYQLTL